jgi:predicted dehydrogenase
MIARARAARTKVMVGFHMRWHAQAIEARRLLRAGALGEIEVIRSVWSNPIRLARALPAWRERRDSGGGCLIELGVHQYDLWRYLLDADVQEIAAVVRSERWPDESATLVGRMQNGTLVSSVLSEVTGCDMEFELYGRAGRLRLACLRYDGLERFAAADTPGGLRRAWRRWLTSLARLPLALSNGSGGDYLASYRRQWEHFAACIRDERPVGCTLEDGRHAVAVARAAVQSASSGVPVAVSPAPRTAGGIAGRARVA